MIKKKKTLVIIAAGMWNQVSSLVQSFQSAPWGRREVHGLLECYAFVLEFIQVSSLRMTECVDLNTLIIKE